MISRLFLVGSGIKDAWNETNLKSCRQRLRKGKEDSLGEKNKGYANEIRGVNPLVSSTYPLTRASADASNVG